MTLVSLQILSYRSWDWVRSPGAGVVRRLLLLLLVMLSLAEMLCLHSLSLLDCWTPRIFSKGEILYPRPRQPVGEGTWRRFCCRARPSWPGGSRAVPGDPAITKISIMSTYSPSHHWSVGVGLTRLTALATNGRSIPLASFLSYSTEDFTHPLPHL